MRKIGYLAAVLAIIAAPVQSRGKPEKERGRSEHSSRNPGKGRGHESMPPSRDFRSADREIILGYYRSQPGGLPPGLAKRGGLPPGLEKQIMRNGVLPPGLEKRFVPLPLELEHRLPPCPEGVRRGFIGGVAVMWSPSSGMVLDAAALFGR